MNKNKNKKIKVLAGLLAFAVLIAAASFAYNSLLVQEGAPENLVQMGTGQTGTGQADASQPDLDQAEPDQTEPGEADSDQTDSSQAEPNQTDSDQTDSNQAESSQADSNQTDSDQTEPDQTETGRPQAPDITVLDIDGNEIQLSSRFGKPIVLNFWATWCPSCVQESPYFEKLYRELGDEVYFMKVNLLDGNRETRSNVERFIENNDLTVPIYFDETGAASVPYGIRFIPVTFFIDTDGNLAGTAQGAVDEQTLRQGIDLAR